MKTRTKGVLFYLFLILYILTALLTLGGLFAPIFHVDYLPEVQFTPIATAYLLPIHLFALWFIGRHSKQWLIAIILLTGISLWMGLRDYNWQAPLSDQEGGLRIVSFNVRTFTYQEANVDSIAMLLKGLNPDVVCLQEFRNLKLDDGRRTEDFLAEALGLPYHQFSHLPIHIQGGVIFSRFPIIAVDTLYMPRDEVNTGVIATLKTPGGPIGVGNLHLSSFHLEGTLKKHDKWKDKIRAVRHQSRQVLQLQQEKVNTVLERVQQYDNPVILTADMNSVRHTRITSQLTRNFRDGFDMRGEGFGWTFPIAGPLGFRIDYQFISKDWQVLEHRVVKSRISDHYPLLGVYRLIPDG